MLAIINKRALLQGCFARRAVLMIDDTIWHSNVPYDKADVQRINHAADKLVQQVTQTKPPTP